MIRLASRQYAAYKKTDSLWYNETPSHWVSGRIKDFVDADISVKTPVYLDENALIEFIPMTNLDAELGMVKNFNFVPLKEVASGYTKFKNGDVVFAKITPCMENGNSAIVSGLKHNICFGSTEFMVFRASPKLAEKYLHYFLHNELFRRNAEPFMKGTAGQKRISSYYMATHFCSLPPVQEQERITNYLDTKTAQIDRKIELLSQKAEKYGKLKQSLINETVTRGLDKSVPMKDSGIEWIGEVPAHWEVKRVKELGNLVLGKMLDNKQGVDKHLKPYLKSKNIGWLKTTDSNIEEMYFSPYEMKLYRIKQDDLLFSEGGEVGKTAFWNQANLECYIQNSVHKFTANKKNNSRYFLYLSFAAGHALFYDSIVSFVSIKHLTKEKLVRVVWLSPPLSEQTTIAEYLDDNTQKIDRIIETVNSQIKNLKELRKTLINDVVTGKIKVVE